MVFGTYRQYDSRWGSKNYNGSSSYAAAACGPTSCANILYAINPTITPVTTGNYMKKNGYAIRNNGTAWNGIPACLKAFGAKDVRQVDKMADVFNYCAKGYVGVFLFRGGSKGGVTWTTSGHYVAITGYKVVNGKHYFKTFDSGGRKHDGWYCYETQMKGLVPRIWLCKVTPEKIKKPTTKYSGALPKPTLKKGSKGNEVVKLQKFLTWYGIKTNDDGNFGGKTEESVIQFQFNEGLTPDGVFGKKSVAAAQKYMAEKTSTSKPAQTTSTSTPKTTAPAQSTSSKIGKCIDVSYWQGKISVENWKKIKETCDYAICRASYTSQKKFSLSPDSTFATNFKNAQKAGLKVGAYHYSQAITVDEAKKEAKYLCDILKDYTVDFYVVCDFEYGGRLSSKIGKKASDIANAFCDVVKANGYSPCIYANTSTLNNNLTNPKYPVWVAQYASSCSYKGKKVMWQYTSSGKVEGISSKNTNNGTSKVDLSYVYDLPNIKPIPKETQSVAPAPKKEPQAYEGKFPSLNTNAKIINGLAYRMCYPYGTSSKKYTFKDGKPKDAYKNGIDKVFPKHKEWPNKRQKVGACCDILTAVELGLVGIKVKKDLKNQLVDMPKMTAQLKSNGHYKAADFKLGDIVYRVRKDMSGHTYTICELVNGKRYIANAHYKHLNGCYAVMDSVVKTENPKKWKYYKCYTVLGAIRTYYMKGDYGYDVLYIQKFLNWYKIPCTADGDFGAKTEAAVKTFQEAMGLAIDGIVGEKTIEIMKKVKK